MFHCRGYVSLQHITMGGVSAVNTSQHVSVCSVYQGHQPTDTFHWCRNCSSSLQCVGDAIWVKLQGATSGMMLEGSQALCLSKQLKLTEWWDTSKTFAMGSQQLISSRQENRMKKQTSYSSGHPDPPSHPWGNVSPPSQHERMENYQDQNGRGSQLCIVVVN